MLGGKGGEMVEREGKRRDRSRYNLSALLPPAFEIFHYF